MTLWMVVALVVIAVLVAALIRSSPSPNSRSSRGSTTAVLRPQFVADEIDETEFQWRRLR